MAVRNAEESRKPRARALKVCLALLFLAALYWHADWRLVASSLANLNPLWLAAAMLLFAPQTLVSAFRWRRLVSPLCEITLADAVRQTLVASTWNLVTPSKLGEFSKAAMLPLAQPLQRVRAAGLVAIEKLADVLALAALWGVGFAWDSMPSNRAILLGLLPVALVAAAASRLGERISAIGSTLRQSARNLRLPHLAAHSVLLWSLHLAQIDCFLKAAGVFVSWHVACARIPAAIFAGLLPVSFCGLGTRDTALVWLFSDVAAPAAMAVVGLLTATRYLVPGLMGIPLVLGGQGTEVAAPCPK